MEESCFCSKDTFLKRANQYRFELGSDNRSAVKENDFFRQRAARITNVAVVANS